ncbi:hypothetical protein DFP72DRAFT_1044507 [Ephemerocybe angulata]|uniref:Uncharacterized protein n=1 Tax=Ephemerocybe angulata TaxID=980116 RepID=A0A8H6I219_9AGAR|nr:hypothetical protein DFP72DRAFT_1044507 [Tulosesus angulatus]
MAGVQAQTRYNRLHDQEGETGRLAPIFDFDYAPKLKHLSLSSASSYLGLGTYRNNRDRWRELLYSEQKGLDKKHTGRVKNGVFLLPTIQFGGRLQLQQRLDGDLSGASYKFSEVSGPGAQRQATPKGIPVEESRKPQSFRSSESMHRTWAVGTRCRYFIPSSVKRGVGQEPSVWLREKANKTERCGTCSSVSGIDIGRGLNPDVVRCMSHESQCDLF